MGRISRIFIICVFVVCSAVPVAAGSQATPDGLPDRALSQEQISEILQAEALRIVDGFVAQFPATLEAMPDNPYRGQMQRLDQLLNDPRFQSVMVATAREILHGADIEAIVQARSFGVVGKQYLQEILRLSLHFADLVTPLIIDRLDRPPLEVS